MKRNISVPVRMQASFCISHSYCHRARVVGSMVCVLLSFHLYRHNNSNTYCLYCLYRTYKTRLEEFTSKMRSHLLHVAISTLKQCCQKYPFNDFLSSFCCSLLLTDKRNVLVMLQPCYICLLIQILNCKLSMSVFPCDITNDITQ